MIFYQIPVEDLVKEFDTDIDTGLTQDKARDRLEVHGPNKLQEEKEKSVPRKFIEQLKDVMILTLLAAVIASFGIAAYNGETKALLEPVLILLIVVLNAIMGLVQESRAENALKMLKELSTPNARVIRGGVREIINAQNLVPGDIIFLEAGDFVPADARLISAAGLWIDESALTGESLPVEKGVSDLISEEATLGDRPNMVYSGCAVTYGKGSAVVTATGMDTEIGKIAGPISHEKPENTPLQLRLSRLGRHLGLIVLIACVLVFFIGIIKGANAMDMVMISVSLAVSAIPDGLPAMVAVVLSIGVQRMADKNTIVKKLPAVETLGGANVICSDKTGTLTENRMTVTSLWPVTAAAPLKYSADMENRESRALIGLAALCCDGNVIFKEDEEEHIGDPTETAIIKAAHLMDMTVDQMRSRSPRVMELPFDSERKLMTTVHSIGDGQYLVITKGAVDAIGSCCVSHDFKRVFGINAKMARQGLRVLAVAMKAISHLPGENKAQAEVRAHLESGLSFVGLIGMIDPPRKEAVEAVMLCRRAGIRPVMITGDHKVTAIAIAEQLGIYRPGDRAVSGVELGEMEDSELSSCIGDISVYARVSPQDKLRIIKAWRLRNAVVAMTGDGVNDVSALRAADIGCAMGITGTDVAKDAADVVLTDDNFATIVTAVKEGRGIYENIKKVTAFLLGTNIGELLTILLAMIFWGTSPLISVQLLWINLITDGLPAIALGMEPEAETEGIIDQKPRSKAEGILEGGLGLRTAIMGAIFAVLSLSAFWIGSSTLGTEGGRTMTFIVLALSQLVHAFSMRSRESLIKIGFLSNKPLLYAALISLAMILIIVFVPPVANVFGMILLPAWMYVAAMSLSLIPFPIMEIFKAAGLIA